MHTYLLTANGDKWFSLGDGFVAGRDPAGAKMLVRRWRCVPITRDQIEAVYGPATLEVWKG
jgi:hypothetical protein